MKYSYTKRYNSRYMRNWRRKYISKAVRENFGIWIDSKFWVLRRKVMRHEQAQGD